MDSNEHNEQIEEPETWSEETDPWWINMRAELYEMEVRCDAVIQGYKDLGKRADEYFDNRLKELMKP